MRYLIIFLSFIFMGLTTLTFAGQAQWETYMEQAKDAYNHRDFDEAVIKLNAARDEAKTFGEQDRRYIMTLSAIGYVYEGHRNYVKSEVLYQKALILAKKAYGSEHFLVGVNQSYLARLCTKLKLKRCELMYKNALATIKETEGPEHQYVAVVLTDLADIYQSEKKYNEAESLYLQALKIYGKEDFSYMTSNITIGTLSFYIFQPLIHKNVVHTISSISALYGEQKRHDEAVSMLLRMEVILKKHFDDNDQVFVSILFNLGKHYREQGRYLRAENTFKQAQEIAERAPIPDYRTLNNISDELEMLEREE